MQSRAHLEREPGRVFLFECLGLMKLLMLELILAGDIMEIFRIIFHVL